MHFSPARGSPFPRYLGNSSTTAPPPHFRSIPERLGLSDAEFNDLLTAEIDEVLLEAAEECGRARSPVCEFAHPTSDSVVNESLEGKLLRSRH